MTRQRGSVVDIFFVVFIVLLAVGCLIFLLYSSNNFIERNETAEVLAEQQKAVVAIKALRIELHNFKPANGGKPYDTAFVLRLMKFYRFGIGGVQLPCRKMVLQGLCRDFVLTALEEMFATCNEAGATSCFEPEALALLRSWLLEFAATAEDDLNESQQERLMKVLHTVETVEVEIQ